MDVANDIDGAEAALRAEAEEKGAGIIVEMETMGLVRAAGEVTSRTVTSREVTLPTQGEAVVTQVTRRRVSLLPSGQGASSAGSEQIGRLAHREHCQGSVNPGFAFFCQGCGGWTGVCCMATQTTRCVAC